MKWLVWCLILCWPGVARCQLDSINPTVIQRSGNIYLQSTDVYYCPFAPPSSHDTRGYLSNASQFLRDSNGINDPNSYFPIVYDTFYHKFDTLRYWAPCYDSVHHRWDTLGQYAVWMRLFQARDKPDHTPSTIWAGSNVIADSTLTHGHHRDVIVSKNEDVDFRASGGVRLESGFHVMPGAFFHAYTDPKWDTTVFSDEFSDTAKFRNNWHVSNGWGGDFYTPGPLCDTESNVRDTTDPDAHDGHALDLFIREDTSKCHCLQLALSYFDSCRTHIDHSLELDTLKYVFSSATVRSCPWPYDQHTGYPMLSKYAHAPYGKFEIREKVPHVQHHMNNWGSGYGFEWDLNEVFNGWMYTIHPSFAHTFRFGPFNGMFRKLGTTVIFVSSAPEWYQANIPEAIIIDNVPYSVQFFSGHGMDTVIAADIQQRSGWPLSLANDTGSLSFYYTKKSILHADSLPWRVDTDAYGKWRVFSAGYHINRYGDTLHFSKTNQPTSVRLTTGFGAKKTFACHWEYNLNNPTDKGKLYLDDSMHISDLHIGAEAYAFTPQMVLYSGHAGYPTPPLPFNGDDTAGGYEYHTFGFEFLPHEVRYLVDSIVVRRFPDRMIPIGTPTYDWVTTMPRSLWQIYLAETDIDNTPGDSLGTNDTVAYVYGGVTYYKSVTYAERKYFEHAAATPGWPGMKNVTIGSKTYPAAHYLFDYVKVWDVPKDVKITDRPQ